MEAGVPAPKSLTAGTDEQQERDHFNGVEVVHRHDERSELDVRAIAMRETRQSWRAPTPLPHPWGSSTLGGGDP
jgi:hypothetical protein